MRHLLITLILLLSFTGCQDKEKEAKVQAQHDAQIAKKVRAEVLAEVEKEKQEATKNEKFNKVGININNGTITIDTNKTKDFFKQFSNTMEVKMKKISDDLQQGIIETKEAGIDINNEHIHIDLNKTKNLLEVWGKKIQIFAQEFDNLAKSIEDNNTYKGQ
jgi:hypothetical protein